MLKKLGEVRAKWRDPSRKRLPPLACLAIIAVIAVIVEVFVFNFRHWSRWDTRRSSCATTPCA